jgi:hypothetical protein
METEALNSNIQQYGGTAPSYGGTLKDKRSGYQGYQYQRRTIISSPNNELEKLIGSPDVTPSKSVIKTPINIETPRTPIDFSNYVGITPLKTDSEIIPKNKVYSSLSPRRTEVNFPNGESYTIPDDHSIYYTDHSFSSKDNFNKHNLNTPQKSIHSNKISPRSISNKHFIRKNGSFSDISTKSNQRNNDTISNRSNYDNYSNRNSRKKHKKPIYEEESSSDFSLTESDNDSSSKYRKKKESKRRREKDENKETKKILRLLMEDLVKRKEIEEQEKNKTNNKTPNNFTNATPDFQIPKSEPIKPKSKIPNYEEMSEQDRDNFREKFRNNYNMLMIKYPLWEIQVPDFINIPLKIIHERYENVVKNICIYQNAMKWKVYLIILIAGIEYYVGFYKGYAFARGLLKAQIKNIHKFDIYLVQFSEQFFNVDGDGDEYPLWIKFIGTFASGLFSFSSINGLSKMIGGSDTELPDFIFEQADKFVSPPEGTAKLHSDGISDVPEPVVKGSYQDPETIIPIIGSGFAGFTGQNKPPTQTAYPQNAKTDDFDDVQF